MGNNQTARYYNRTGTGIGLVPDVNYAGITGVAVSAVTAGNIQRPVDLQSIGAKISGNKRTVGIGIIYIQSIINRTGIGSG